MKEVVFLQFYLIEMSVATGQLSLEPVAGCEVDNLKLRVRWCCRWG